MNRALIAAIVCLWAAAAPAQQTEGFFAGIPTALSVAKGTAANPLHPYAMHLKPAGFHQQAPCE